MKSTSMKNIFLAGGLAVSMLATAGVSAKDFPSRTITIVVPFAAGGASDITARLIGKNLSTKMGVPVIVENKAGANSQIGTMAVINSKPDGYTMLMGTTSLINNPLLYKNLPYNAKEGLRPVAGVVDVPAFLMVSSESHINTVEDLLKEAKAKNKDKKTLNFASAGAGSTLHLAAEHLKLTSGFDAVHIPYKGSGPASVGLAGGEVDFSMENYGPALPHIDSGRIKVLAIASPERFPALPNVPTFKEAGLDGTDLASWFGLFAPSKTPDDVINTLNKSVNEVMQLPDVQKQLIGLGLVPRTGSPDDMSQRMSQDSNKWESIIKNAHVSVE